jgi:hypothetical protein
MQRTGVLHRDDNLGHARLGGVTKTQGEKGKAK